MLLPKTERGVSVGWKHHRRRERSENQDIGMAHKVFLVEYEDRHQINLLHTIPGTFQRRTTGMYTAVDTGTLSLLSDGSRSASRTIPFSKFLQRLIYSVAHFRSQLL